MKKIRYMIEAAFLWIAFVIFKALPAETASNAGGWIGRNVGTRLAASRKAYKNLERALPGKTESEYNAIVCDMWDNLGRVIAEYPHLPEIVMKADIVGEDHVKNLPDSFIVIGGHVANWELLPFYFNHRADLPMTGLYREPNNPYVAAILERARNATGKGSYARKSTAGSRALIKTLQDGGRLGILIDQKYNQGIQADFFGLPAMTSASFAQLARKYDCPLVPLWVERVKGTQFRLTIDEPYKVDGRSDEDIVALAHEALESHILKNPGQWLWLHRRWIT